MPEVGINFAWQDFWLFSPLWLHIIRPLPVFCLPLRPWVIKTFCFTALALVSLESAERPNYFLYVHDNDTLSLKLWRANSEFHQRATFFHHQGLWIPGYSAFELYSKKGYFIVFMGSSVKASKYDDSEEFKQSSSFSIEGALPESSKEEHKFLGLEDYVRC